MKTKAIVPGLLCIGLIFILSAAFTSDDVKTTRPNPTVQKKVDQVFRNFFLHRQRDAIVLNWTVSSSDCSGFYIQKSYDGEYFDDIYGSITTTGKWNSYTDNEVFPGYIYYRVVAVLNDGSNCHSQVQVIRIVRRK
ncbi:MAG TPA: hypothetical protein VGD17_03445 [Chitinophagaceae bacterium]